jgi:hypothetical protein
MAFLVPNHLVKLTIGWLNVRKQPLIDKCSSDIPFSCSLFAFKNYNNIKGQIIINNNL